MAHFVARIGGLLACALMVVEPLVEVQREP